MRISALATALTTALLVASVGTVAWPDAKADRDFKLASAHLEKGRGELGRVRSLDTNARRLDALDRAIYFLRRARTVTSAAIAKGPPAPFADLQKAVESELLRALNEETMIYLGRKSLSLAAARNAAALALAPRDRDALYWATRIESARNRDVFETFDGSVAIDRVRARRAAMGVPLRDRGIGNRR